MSKLTDDPEFTAEMLSMMGRELKQARQRIKDLESFKEAYTANDVLSPAEEDRLRDFRERTDAAEEAMELMRNHVQNVNRENQRLRQEVANLQSRSVVKTEVSETVLPAQKREFKEQGVSVRLKDKEEQKKVVELEAALEKYYAKYVAVKNAKNALEEEKDSLANTQASLEIKHKDASLEIDRLQEECSSLTAEKAMAETKLKEAVAKMEILQNGKHTISNYRTLLPIVKDIGDRAGPTPPVSQPVSLFGVDLTAYLESDPRTEKYSKSILYSPHLLHFPDDSGRSALWLRPLFEFDGRSWASWVNIHSLRPPLGRVFTVFYPVDDCIFYAGQFTVVQIFPRSQHDQVGYVISTKDAKETPVIDSIAHETLSHRNHGSRFADVQRLYLDGVLQLGAVGLKFSSFDHELHDTLGQRFQASLPVDKRRKFKTSKLSNIKAAAGGSTSGGDLHRDKRRKT